METTLYPSQTVFIPPFLRPFSSSSFLSSPPLVHVHLSLSSLILDYTNFLSLYLLIFHFFFFTRFQ